MVQTCFNIYYMTSFALLMISYNINMSNWTD